MIDIYAFALSKGEINVERLVDAVRSSRNLAAEPTFAAILGLIDPEVEIEKLPKVVVTSNNCVRRMSSANFYTQTVYYDYEYPSDRYFPTEEDAEKYAKTGEYSYSKCSNVKKDEYPFKGTYMNPNHGDCSFEEWLRCKPFENEVHAWFLQCEGPDLWCKSPQYPFERR